MTDERLHMTPLANMVEEFSLVAEKFENLTLALLNIPTIPDRIHVEALRAGLPEVQSELWAAIHKLANGGAYWSEDDD